MSMSKEDVKKCTAEWREQVRNLFSLYVLNVTDDEIDYCFLSEPNRAKRVLTDEQFNQWLKMWRDNF